ncbi:hypothetical protein H5410_040814 [Solanum commersonii]|uniref:Uncharacterized protein n=1 Tax=Solanum commersonii TaxID=4109 RepID=A0A9J5XSL9_SOLCO|nr:hypothetical protein H5410_040814 [Solanum commersonii]
MIMSPDEKKGGKPHQIEKNWDFITCMDDCAMVDVVSTGLRFTWCNTRGKPYIIWKRLDRVFFNHQWTDLFSSSDIEHLASMGSNHTPMKCSSRSLGRGILGEQHVEISIETQEFKQKVEHMADYIDNEIDNLKEQLHKAQAEHTKWLKFEESILRQKDNIRWLEEGGANTKYFHAIINEKKRRLNIQRIQNRKGNGLMKSLEAIIGKLQDYQKCSGQLIDTDKSCFLVGKNATTNQILRIKDITGYMQEKFPITYLGCPLYIGRQLTTYYGDMVNKIIKRITGSHGKNLSQGGRFVLMKHMLHSLHIHLLSVVESPKEVFDEVERHMDRFFWGSLEGKQKYHWSAWDKMSYPNDERGLGLRRLQDVSESMFISPIAKPIMPTQSLI